jgi:hypothetical protein
MKKVLATFILCTVITLNGYALIEVGLEGGYFFGNLTFKEVYQKTTTTEAGSTWVEDTTYTPTGKEAETKHPKGFGLSLFGEITPPFLPIGIELKGGFSSTGFKETEIDTKGSRIDTATYSYTINSIGFSLLGKYSLKMPVFSPYIKIGPFFAFNTHKLKFEDVPIALEYDRTFNFGISCGIGAKMGLIPKFPLTIGLLYNYYIVSKAEYTAEWSPLARHVKTEGRNKFSQQDIGIFFGITHKIL